MANAPAGCDLLRVRAVEDEDGVPLDDPFPCELRLCPMCTCHKPVEPAPAESILLRRGDLVTRDTEGKLWLLFGFSRIPIAEEQNTLLIEARWRASISRHMGFAELMYGGRVVGYGPFPPTPTLDPVALRLLKWMRGMLDGQKGRRRVHRNVRSVAVELRERLIAQHDNSVLKDGLVMVHDLDALFLNTHVGLRDGASDSLAVIASAIDLKGKPVPACFPVSMRVGAAAPAYLGLTEVPLLPPLTAQEVLEEEEEAGLRQLGPWGVRIKEEVFEKQPRTRRLAVACMTQLLLAHGGCAETKEAKAVLKERPRGTLRNDSSFVDRARCCRVALERSGQRLNWGASSCTKTSRLVLRHVLAASGCDASLAREVEVLLSDLDRFGSTPLPELVQAGQTAKYTIRQGLSLVLRSDQQDRPRLKTRPAR